MRYRPYQCLLVLPDAGRGTNDGAAGTKTGIFGIRGQCIPRHARPIPCGFFFSTLGCNGLYALDLAGEKTRIGIAGWLYSNGLAVEHATLSCGQFVSHLVCLPDRAPDTLVSLGAAHAPDLYRGCLARETRLALELACFSAAPVQRSVRGRA